MSIISFLTLMAAVSLVVFSRLAARKVREDRRQVLEALDESSRQLEEVASIVDRILPEVELNTPLGVRGQRNVYKIMIASFMEEARRPVRHEVIDWFPPKAVLRHWPEYAGLDEPPSKKELANPASLASWYSVPTSATKH